MQIYFEGNRARNYLFNLSEKISPRMTQFSASDCIPLMAESIGVFGEDPEYFFTFHYQSATMNIRGCKVLVDILQAQPLQGRLKRDKKQNQN